jgi:hypothetical protein
MSQVQDSYNSTPFADVIDAITERLRAVFTQGGYVRVIASPENRIPQYKAEEGVSVYVSSPRPLPKNGAGRYGRNTTRDIVVVVATQSLLDEAGSDETAVKAHCTLEESVCNTLEQSPPVGVAYNIRIGTLIEWVEGGEDIVRQMKIDPGMLVSALRFRVQYVQPMQVYRN